MKKGSNLNNKELLGKRIKELRRQKDYTQDYLAEKLKIEPRQLSKLETGKHYPSFETIISLLETFDITFEELTSFKHLETKENLKQSIIEELDNTDEEKLKSIYKIIRSLVH